MNCCHDEFLDFDCGIYKCSECGQEFMVSCDGQEGNCQFCNSEERKQIESEWAAIAAEQEDK